MMPAWCLATLERAGPECSAPDLLDGTGTSGYRNRICKGVLKSGKVV